MQIRTKSSEFHRWQNLYFSSQRLLEHLSVQPRVYSYHDNRKVKALPGGGRPSISSEEYVTKVVHVCTEHGRGLFLYLCG